MSKKRIRSRGRHSKDFSSEIDDTIEPLENVNASLGSEQQQHRTRRRSSVPILDIKFLQTLSNQFDTESNEAITVPEDMCECD
jgi:hypothetical protein